MGEGRAFLEILQILKNRVDIKEDQSLPTLPATTNPNQPPRSAMQDDSSSTYAEYPEPNIVNVVASFSLGRLLPLYLHPD